jgi:hypothetical protein
LPTNTEAIPENIKLPHIILIAYKPVENPLSEFKIKPVDIQSLSREI